MTRSNGVYAVVCALALGAVVFAYANHFDNGFHFDDSHVLLNNLAIRSLGNTAEFFRDANTFSARPENASYRPLLTLTYALDYWAGGGLTPRAFHRTQFALLLVLGLLLVVLCGHLFDLGHRSPWNRYVALFCATVFCIHTANTETVNYVSSRSSLLASLGVVAALLAYVRWPLARRTGLYLVPMVLGALTKPLSVMFAPLLLCYIFFLEQQGSLAVLGFRNRWRKFRAAVVQSLPAFGVGAVLYVFLASMASDALRYAVVSRLDYARSQPFVWLHYFRLFFWPTGLTADTDWGFTDTWRDPSLWAGVTFVVALVAAIVLASTSPRWRPAAFGLAWFALALMPTSSIIPLSEVYNEHRIFFPYIGLTIAAGWTGACLLDRVGHRGVRIGAGVVAAVAVLAALGVGTHERNEVWRDDESLWRDVALKSPGNGRGLMNYGLALMRRGRLEEALEYYDRATVFNPNYAFLEVNLAIVKSALGRNNESEAHFRRALRLDPAFGQGRFFYARWLNKQGRGPEALEQLEQAIRTSPWETETRTLLMRMYAAVGDRDALLRTAQETLSMSPSDPKAIAYSRGRIPQRAAQETAEAYEVMGRQRLDAKMWIDAANINRHALTLNADSSIAWNNLGWSLGQLGFFDLAVPCFRRAFELDPQMEVARNNLNWALRQSGSAPVASPAAR